MPANITLFERLGYLAVILDLITAVIENYAPQGDHLGTYGLAALLGAGAVFGALLVWATARLRKNWLRILFTVLVAVGVSLEAYAFVKLHDSGTSLSWALDITECILDVVCVYLLYSGASREWFRGNGVRQVTA
jgi:hypothetical protein